MSAIKVFQLDGCDCWAGESLEACIAEARRQCGADAYEDAEEIGYELPERDMNTRLVYMGEDRKSEPVTFAQALAKFIATPGERFPLFFCSTEA